MVFKTFHHTARHYAQIMGIDMEEFHEIYGKNTTQIAIVEMLGDEGFQIGKLIAPYRGPNTYIRLIKQLVANYK